MIVRTFPVVEVFGPTIQGEGPLAGAVSHFVRFGGCDYRCVWCDSAPAVLPPLVRGASRLTLSEVLAKIKGLPPAQWVTISGGNPALFEADWLVKLLKMDGFFVAVETQGTIWKPWLAKVDQLTISPKPPSSRMAWHTDSVDFMKALRLIETGEALERPGAYCFKVPVYDRRDFEWAMALHQQYPWIKFYLSIVTQMGGLEGAFVTGGAADTSEDVLERYRKVVAWTLAEPSMADVRVIPQLHVLIWGSTTRGV